MSNRLRQFASLLVLTLFATIAANAGEDLRAGDGNPDPRQRR